MMHNTKNELLDSLVQIKGNGSFATSHSAPFIFPHLEVTGLGEIAYPVNALQAKALIQIANKAPFGKGSETIIDQSVRSAWEIDSSKLRFTNNQWVDFLNKVLNTIKPQLGIEDYEIEANLYKMLIYEKDDFFLSHRDSEKEKGMFGTLIIGLPSIYKGGELLVRFDGEEQSINFADLSEHHRIAYVAFYADCEHEVKPLTDGYRVCLVYNLIQRQAGKKIELEPLAKHVARLAGILKEGKSNQSLSPGIVLLGHQYTPENFSMEQLKLNDRTRAEALIRAANKAGYYAKMCLVTSHIAGTPAYEGGGYYDDYGDEPDEDATMEEVHDEQLYIEHWLNNDVPPLRNVAFDENDLIATFQLNEDEPIVKESTGYMGNYGPDLMHWYHYGAVFFWPKENHKELLLTQNIGNQLEWIGYYNTIRASLSSDEIQICESILKGLVLQEGIVRSADYNVIADWIMGYQDESCFHELGYHLIQTFFLKINEDSWRRLIETYPRRHYEKIIDSVASGGDSTSLAHLLSVLHASLGSPTAEGFVKSQLPKLPDYFTQLEAVKLQKPPVKAEALDNLLKLEHHFPQEKTWVERITVLLTDNKDRKYINTELLATILALDKPSPLAKALLSVGTVALQKRVNNMPKPPENWSRPFPDKIQSDRYANYLKMLAPFLLSPDTEVLDFQKVQADRNEMESAIHSVKIDLRTETIRKGSPHTLRIIKTQASYENQMKEWREDVNLLKAAEEKMKAFD